MRQRLQALTEAHSDQLDPSWRARYPVAASKHLLVPRHTAGDRTDAPNAHGMPASAGNPEARPSGSGPTSGPAGNRPLHQPHSNEGAASAPSGLRPGSFNARTPSHSDFIGMPTASGLPSQAAAAGIPSGANADPAPAPAFSMDALRTALQSIEVCIRLMPSPP